MNLFAKAKVKNVAKAPKAAKEEVVIVEPAFHLTLTRLAELKIQQDALEAESSILAAQVKERSIAEFAKLYDENGKYPGSFVIRASGMKKMPSASLMFLPTDKYIKIDEDRYNELAAEFGPEMVTEKTTYIMDSELIEKHGEVLSDLINKCKAFTEADKAKLIKAVTTYEVAKGTISELKNEKFAKYGIENMLSEIKPVYQMKNVKVDEETV
jgi:hypothetical protein